MIYIIDKTINFSFNGAYWLVFLITGTRLGLAGANPGYYSIDLNGFHSNISFGKSVRAASSAINIASAVRTPK